MPGRVCEHPGTPVWPCCRTMYVAASEDLEDLVAIVHARAEEGVMASAEASAQAKGEAKVKSRSPVITLGSEGVEVEEVEDDMIPTTVLEVETGEDRRTDKVRPRSELPT